jgi:hypothetical protein
VGRAEVRLGIHTIPRRKTVTAHLSYDLQSFIKVTVGRAEVRLGIHTIPRRKTVAAHLSYDLQSFSKVTVGRAEVRLGIHTIPRRKTVTAHLSYDLQSRLWINYSTYIQFTESGGVDVTSDLVRSVSSLSMQNATLRRAMYDQFVKVNRPECGFRSLLNRNATATALVDDIRKKRQ